MQLNSLTRPFSVSFEVTNKCNLDCVFCSARLKEYSRDDLTTEQITNIIARLADEGILDVFLTGGEPFLRSDLAEIIDACLRRGMNITLSTNGTNVSAEAAKSVLAAGLDEIQVSLHGLASVHDALVQRIGAFDSARQGLRHLVEAGLRVSIAAVAMKSNYQDLPALARETAKRGAKFFRLLRLMPHSIQLAAEQLSEPQMIGLAQELSNIQTEFEDFTVRIHTSPGLGDERFWTSREHALVHPLCHTCTAGKLSMGILANGDCVPCVELKQPEFVCGNILRDGVGEVWGSKPMRQLRQIAPEKYVGECALCEAKWTCYSARCVAYHLCSNLLSDDVTCYRLKRIGFHHAVPEQRNDLE